MNAHDTPERNEDDVEGEGECHLRPGPWHRVDGQDRGAGPGLPWRRNERALTPLCGRSAPRWFHPARMMSSLAASRSNIDATRCWRLTMATRKQHTADVEGDGVARAVGAGLPSAALP